MKRLLAVVTAAAVLMTGCGSAEENNYVPTDDNRPLRSEGSADNLSETESDSCEESVLSVSVSQSAVSSSSSAVSSASSSETEKKPDYLLRSVYSGGKNYRVGISGKPDKDGLFRNLTLTLYTGNKKIDELKTDVTYGDRVLIMESASSDRSYGCEVLSNYSEFGAGQYPDIIALDFYRNSEIEIPQYQRFFAIYDGKLTELAIYENGVKSRPIGAHVELSAVGVMKQKLCVWGAEELVVRYYRYVFDVAGKCLLRTEY